MATQKKQQQDRELTVIGRYAMKTKKVLNGHVCTKVRNSDGAEYQVWTHANGCTSSCECEGYQKWHKVCYHIGFVEAREQLRKAGQSTANTAIVAALSARQVTKKAPAARKVAEPVAQVASESTTPTPTPTPTPAAVVVAEPSTITDEDVEAVLAEIDALAQPVAETAAAVVATTEPVKVAEIATAPRKREVSSVEREMPAFLMAGGSRGGYLPGRAPSTKAS